MAEDQRKKQKKSAFLPDLVTDILLRLPVMSLLRFRCLSTSVCTVIDSADFVKNHLNRSIQSKTGQKLIIVNSYLADFYVPNFFYDLQGALKSPCHCTTFVSDSCNGLIVLGMSVRFETNNSIVNYFAMWNPFTRQYKKLPLHPVQTLPGYKTFTRLGLGYDSTLDDYKFVMIIEVHNAGHVSFQVWIFSLKSNSWRKSRDLPMVDDKCGSEVGCFANGALYWKWEDNVLGFDLADEVFFEVPLFSDCGQKITCKHCLVVVAGNLYSPVIRDDHNTDYYLLAGDKGGEAAARSWRKEFTVHDERHSFHLSLPLAYSKEGDSILVRKLYSIFWYNLENKTTELWVERVPYYSKVIYWESLVSLGNDSEFVGAADKVIIYDLER